MKQAYYFSHDSNARYDPDILAMRSVYGSEGYGWYWILIETLRDQGEYKLGIQSKYAYNAFASQMQCDSKKAEEFISDCINEFKLFASDGKSFWSNSLIRRMGKIEEKSEKARNSANARWSNKTATEKETTTIINKLKCEDNANASKNDAIKESKVNKSKVKKIKENNKITYAEFVTLTETEHQKLIDQYGPTLTNEMVSVLDNYKGSNGKTYESDYRAILSWVVERVTTTKPKAKDRTNSGKPKLEVYRDPPTPEIMSYEEHREGRFIAAQIDKTDPPTEAESKKEYRAYQVAMGADGVMSDEEIEEVKRKMRDLGKPKELVPHE